MRLRMLGHGHSVHFLASNEVHQKIIDNRDTNNNNINDIATSDILLWVLQNTRAQIIDGFSYWAT